MSDKLYLSWSKMEDLTSMLQHAIAPRRTGDTTAPEPTYPIRSIVGISRGGLVPMAILANRLNIRQPNLGIVYASSYNHSEKQHAVQVHTEAATADLLKCKDTLVVDEIYDSGTTFQALHKLFPNPIYAALYRRTNSPDLPGLLWFDNAPMGKWLVFPWE